MDNDELIRIVEKLRNKELNGSLELHFNNGEIVKTKVIQVKSV